MALIDLANPTRFLALTARVLPWLSAAIVGRDGNIAYKLIGPITERNLASVLRPEIEKALAAKSTLPD